MPLTGSRLNCVLALTGLLVLALFIAGPIGQAANYHHFADSRSLFGIPNGADVLSNLGFLMVGLYGWFVARRNQAGAAWRAFSIALVATAFGSAWYHLAPDNARLVWDRLPIALACAALLAAVLRDILDEAMHAPWMLPALLLSGVASVAWWTITGDLRPYLLLQIAPVVLIPVLQWLAATPMARRKAFGVAIGLYVLAKLLELGDASVFQAQGLVSGHTAKHLAATLAALVLVRCAARSKHLGR